ncbi:MAG TPA: type II toxin-antitoxin system prevent-host-death family antitoxin [Bryobacteraceae bacterium]|jgi:prevent-host-death family protein|nr:type II toxin-antitoxin system prevent-host-death family antitoxin [Bryobacteraceae bacterium]
MREVKISELKARLSHYVRLAESGEEVVVKERNRPVARLTACQPRESPGMGEPRRVSPEEAARIFALLPLPKIDRKMIRESLRLMQKGRSRRLLS